MREKEANDPEVIKANKKWEREQAAKQAKLDGPRKRKGKHQQMAEEWDELAREERLYKKLKKGQISQKQVRTQTNTLTCVTQPFPLFHNLPRCVNSPASSRSHP